MPELSFLLWIATIIGCFMNAYYNWSLLLANVFLQGLVLLYSGFNPWMCVAVPMNIVNCAMQYCKEKKGEN